MARTKTIITVEEIRKRLTPLFSNDGLKLVLLFGSVSSGKVHGKSDIDLAFLFDGPVDVLELTSSVSRLLQTDNVDVIDLKRANPLLKYMAVKNSKVLYEKLPGVFAEFGSLAFRMYVDTKKLRDARAVSIKHFIEARRHA